MAVVDGFGAFAVFAAEPAAPPYEASPNRVPSVTIRSPTNGQVVPFLSPAYFHGTASDGDGVVTQVMYFVNGQPIGTGSGHNWLITWFATNLGPHVLTARATDNKAASADSAPIRFKVQTFVPQLILLDPDRLQEIIEPLDGAILRVGSTNRFIASLDVFFPVHSTELLVNGVKANTPRRFTDLIWIPTNLGLHRLQAVMADRSGIRLTSGPVTVTIADVRPPSLTILSPAHKSSFARDATVTIRASATDARKQITNMTAVVTGIKTWISQGPTIEGTVSNLTSGWHRTEVRAVNDSAQTTRGYVEFFVAYEINPGLPVPEGFAVDADAPDSATATWKPPTPKGAAVWLTTEQRPAAGEWIEVGGCPAEDGEFVAGQLEADTSYEFRIAFLDKDQRRSGYSSIVNLKTRPWRNATAQSPTKRPR